MIKMAWKTIKYNRAVRIVRAGRGRFAYYGRRLLLITRGEPKIVVR